MNEHDNYHHKLNERLFRCKNAKEDARTEYDLGHISLSVLNNRLKEFDTQIGEIEVELQTLSLTYSSTPLNRPTGAVPTQTWDVFISYQRAAEAEARDVHDKLIAAGFTVWQDVHNIRHSARWSQEIDGALHDSARLVLLLTPESMASPEVFNEWFFFYDERKPLHCLYVATCDRHYQLRPFQYLDWRDPAKRDWARLSAELRDDFNFPVSTTSTPIVTAPTASSATDESSGMPLPRAFADLLEAVRDPAGSIAFTVEQIKQLSDHVPTDSTEYHLTRIVAWSQARYALDKRFVQLTLLIDQGENAQGVRWQNVEQRRYSDLREVLAERSDDRALVLLGAPGAGKSTLLRRLQMDSAIDSLRKDNQHVTFFIQMNHYRVDSGSPRAWLAVEWTQQYPTLPPLDTLLRERRVLLLLDALNEMPHKSTADYHERVELWRQFIVTLESGNRVVFSCRSLDYSATLSSPDLRVPQLVVQSMSDAQIREFLMAYLPTQADLVWRALDGKPQLDIFRTPYFLKLLCEQVEATSNVPKGKAELFTGYVRSALQREVINGNRLLLPNGLLTEHDIRKLTTGKWRNTLELPERGVLPPKLAGLAYAMQQKGLDTDGAQIRLDYDDACDLLASERATDILKVGVALNVLDEDVARDEVLFFHQLLQEFFSARKLAKAPDPELVCGAWRADSVKPSLADTIAGLADSDPLPPLPQTGWEETTVLAAALSNKPDAFVRSLIDMNLPLAARCGSAPDVMVSEPLKNDLRHALIARTQDMTADLRARIAAGLALGDLGDPRFERRTGLHGDYLLPPMATISAGTYPMGDDNSQYDNQVPAHTVTLETFQLGIFLVTNAEYALFITAGGYEDEQWWHTDPAKAWRTGLRSTQEAIKQWRDTRINIKHWSDVYIDNLVKDNRATSKQAKEFTRIRDMRDEEFERQLDTLYPSGKRYSQPGFWDDTEFNGLSQPVIGICLYEAQAYCAWLSAQTRRVYRLPTETEFEAAARDKTERAYPYGEMFDVTRSNTFESHIRCTTPVGIFNNATAQGCFDLSGNVSTWTSSVYKPSLHDSSDRPEHNDIAGTRRAARGGSWYFDQSIARSVYRTDYISTGRSSSHGFRLVSASHPVSG